MLSKFWKCIFPRVHRLCTALTLARVNICRISVGKFPFYLSLAMCIRSPFHNDTSLSHPAQPSPDIVNLISTRDAWFSQSILCIRIDFFPQNSEYNRIRFTANTGYYRMPQHIDTMTVDIPFPNNLLHYFGAAAKLKRTVTWWRRCWQVVCLSAEIEFEQHCIWSDSAIGVNVKNAVQLKLKHVET